MVGANGGIISKYSVGIYSTEAADWVSDDSAQLCADVAARPTTPVTEQADGPATIETYTVRYDWPVRTGIVIGRLDADGSRFLALSDDPDLVGLLSEGEPLGARIIVDHNGETNQAVPG
jgi:acetyl-CoA C-acetyltransferase